MRKSDNFIQYLHLEEYAEGTILKYTRDVDLLLDFIGNRPISKTILIAYKKTLEARLSASSVNRTIAGINCYLKYMELDSFCLKSLKIQPITSTEHELTRREFKKLIQTAFEQNNIRIALILSTLAGTGIRISELKFITVTALETGLANIHSKGKIRTIVLQRQLQDILLDYCLKMNIFSGPIFVSQSGHPLSRPYLSTQIKKIAQQAGIDPCKAFPHNFRHFFARQFLESGAPVTDLADYLGHNSINTTRRYLLTSMATKQKQLAKIPIYTNPF